MVTNDAHDLMPAEIAESIPPIYGTQNERDPVARLKLFTPDSSWTWYIVEFDPAERLCFGLIIAHDHKFAYFSLVELLELRGPLGLQVERDLYFQPTTISRCK